MKRLIEIRFKIMTTVFWTLEYLLAVVTNNVGDVFKSEPDE
jgi:hypothetical protein